MVRSARHAARLTTFGDNAVTGNQEGETAIPEPGHSVVHVESYRGSRPYSRQIFGQFIEHFHRQIYGGIYEPGSPLSDDAGYRTDVIDAVRALRVPIVRWPGGCFVSAYHWLNGVGSERAPGYDKAWYVEDPNTFGTNEFIEWCRRVGAEPYICTNAGSGRSSSPAAASKRPGSGTT